MKRLAVGLDMAAIGVGADRQLGVIGDEEGDAALLGQWGEGADYLLPVTFVLRLGSQKDAGNLARTEGGVRIGIKAVQLETRGVIRKASAYQSTLRRRTRLRFQMVSC